MGSAEIFVVLSVLLFLRFFVPFSFLPSSFHLLSRYISLSRRTPDVIIR